MANKELMVAVFDSENAGLEVLEDLKKRKHLNIYDLEDAAVVVKDKNGKIHLKQTKEITPLKGAIGGSLVGLFTGIVTIINPLAVAIVGGTTGVLWGLFNDIGIDDDFMKKVGEEITPGSSAVFFLASKEFHDILEKEMESFNGKIFRTDIPDKAHEELLAKSILEWEKKREGK